MQNFIEQLLNGISTGSIYALIAIGYTMVYGIAKMINFAHGDIIMVGAYTLYVCVARCGCPIPFSIFITIMVCALLGIGIEKVAYRPVRNAPTLAVLITAIGMSYLLQNLALLIFHSNPIAFSSILPSGFVGWGSFTISINTIITIIITVISMIMLSVFIHETKTGTAMRAVSEDKDAARLMGINVDHTIAVTFFIGCALAAVAGILYVSKYEMLRRT